MDKDDPQDSTAKELKRLAAIDLFASAPAAAPGADQITRQLGDGRFLDLAGSKHASHLATINQQQDTSFSKLMLEQERLRRLLSPYDELTRATNSFSSAMLNREAQALVAATGGVADLLKRSQSLLPVDPSAFYLPERERIHALLSANAGGPVTRWFEREGAQRARLKEALDALQNPWLQHADAKRSLHSMAELHGIGKALQRFQGFEIGFADALRQDFGDWRAEMDFSRFDLTDPDIRVELYVEQGLNVSLTDFPEEAFAEGLASAELAENYLLEQNFDALNLDHGSSGERAAQSRALLAFQTLFRLERALRDFIDDEMTRVHGGGWEQSRLPSETFKSWKGKADAAKSRGEPVSRLIDYADFSDYAPIICRRDDFASIFKVCFRSQESVRESFNRLTPLRHGTMHARVFGLADVLFLMTESARLLKAMGFSVGNAR